jgi:hypothetical protein
MLVAEGRTGRVLGPIVGFFAFVLATVHRI